MKSTDSLKMRKNLLLVLDKSNFNKKYIRRLAKFYKIYLFNHVKYADFKNVKFDVLLLLTPKFEEILKKLKKYKQVRPQIFISFEGNFNESPRKKRLDVALKNGYNVIYPDEHGKLIPGKIVDTIFFSTHRIKHKIKKEVISDFYEFKRNAARLAKEFSRIGKKLETNRLNYEDAGCISKKTNSGFFITSSGHKISDLSISGISLVVKKGKRLFWIGFNPPSSETPLHHIIYKNLRNIRYIIHAHCPQVTYSQYLEKYKTPNYVEYGRINTGKSILSVLKKQKGIAILRYHGIVSVGRTLSEAYDKLFNLERQTVYHENRNNRPHK